MGAFLLTYLLQATRKLLLLIGTALLLISASLAQPLTAGADLSYVPNLEYHGAVYTVDGQPGDVLDIFYDAGYRVVRLRLWHTPDEPWHGIDSTLAFAQRVTDAGFDLLLDFHYSDTWADPGTQTKPAAWAELYDDTLVDSVYRYTNNVLMRFRDVGALPAIVQLGNEIQPGFLWNTGRVSWDGGPWDTNQQWIQFTTLLNAAAEAVIDSLPEATHPDIMLHIHGGSDSTGARWFFDHIEYYEVPYDLIGVSYYPWWHGTIEELDANLDALATRYQKPVWVVETAYPWTLENDDDHGNFVYEQDQLPPGYYISPQAQAGFYNQLESAVHAVPDELGAGVCLWEPAYIVVDETWDCPWENLAVFDFEGEALPGLGWHSNGIPEETSAPLMPSGFHVSAAYPNPFNSDTRVRIYLPVAATVEVEVFDVLGRRVSCRPTQRHGIGEHELVINGSGWASGVYMLRVTAGKVQQQQQRLVLLR